MQRRRIEVMLGGGGAALALLAVTLSCSRCGPRFGYTIRSNSMTPALLPQDRVYVERISDAAFLNRWDIVVFRPPVDHKWIFVMRIIGLPGETVQIRDGSVLIDGVVQTVPDDLASLRYRTYSFMPFGESPFVVPTNSFFILGDNVAGARDSRQWGVVTITNIVGRVVALSRGDEEFCVREGILAPIALKE